MRQIVKTAVVILSMVFIGFTCQNSEKSADKASKTVSESTKSMVPHESPSPPQAANINNQLPEELVCMVNDAYMGIQQFPVPVGNKIYYGCCEMCVDKLQGSDEFRYGIDPLTREKVDKVGAYIVRQSDKTYAVFYFKSKENYETYMREKSS